jgi:hypothetical protein
MNAQQCIAASAPLQLLCGLTKTQHLIIFIELYYCQCHTRQQCVNVMHNHIRHFITLVAMTLTISTFAQETSSALTKRIIVKTNLLSLVARRPTVTLEKMFSNSVSAEASFVQGEFNDFLFTDHYDYSGFLLRAKKHFTDLEFGGISPYVALYVGNLRRTIQTTGQVDNTGFWGYPSRDFSANSIRGGGSLGLSYISKSKIIVDGLMSLGYGKYTRVYKPDVNRNSSGYLDTQIWLSVGYCF